MPNACPTTPFGGAPDVMDSAEGGVAVGADVGVAVGADVGVEVGADVGAGVNGGGGVTKPPALPPHALSMKPKDVSARTSTLAVAAYLNLNNMSKFLYDHTPRR